MSDVEQIDPGHLPITRKPKMLIGLLGCLTTLGVLAGLFYFYLLNLNEPPATFAESTTFVIESGESVSQVTKRLEKEGLIKSEHLLYYTIAWLRNENGVIASTYHFSDPLTTLEIAKLITQGDFAADLIRFTHIEGESNERLSNRATRSLPNFNQQRFLENASEFEGKLFPDTYFIPSSYDDQELVNLMLETYENKVGPLRNQIEQMSLTEYEVITLASIIEREANTRESKRMVSSVLQNRLEIGMPLQTDASIEYILNKPLSELTPDDLEIESPYNTYLNAGLPPTPIGNPGLEAIEAVIRPADTDYFYYITGNDGEFYYAENYQQHLRNIEQHLR